MFKTTKSDNTIDKSIYKLLNELAKIKYEYSNKYSRMMRTPPLELNNENEFLQYINFNREGGLRKREYRMIDKKEIKAGYTADNEEVKPVCLLGVTNLDGSSINEDDKEKLYCYDGEKIYLSK